MRPLTTTMDTDGAITIPTDVRTALGLRSGTIFTLVVDQGRLIVQPLLANSLEELRGIFASDRDVVAELQAERRQDKW